MFAAIPPSRKTDEVPATNRSAPAWRILTAFSKETLPSTSMRTCGYPALSSMARSRAILGSVAGTSFWPAKPGFTVMSRTMSRSGRMSSMAHRGVAGFRVTAAFAPAARMAESARCRCTVDSWCTETTSPGRRSNRCRCRSGFFTIRWMSAGTALTLRTARITSGPSMKFGTKSPSMTS